MKYLLEERFILNEEDTLVLDDDEDTTSNTKEINWDLEFSKVKTAAQLESFWSTYYKTIFGDKATAIRKKFHLIIDTIKKEYGWTAEENPIIRLLVTKTDQVLSDAAGYSDMYLNKILKAAKQNLINLDDLAKPNEELKLGAYDIINNINFRQLKSESEVKAWLELRKHALTADSENKGKIFANSYLLQGSTNAEMEQVSNVQTGKLAELTIATRKLSKFLGKDLAGKQDFSDEEQDTLLKGCRPEELKIYFYYCYDILPAISTENCFKALGDNVAAALKKYKNTQQKAVTAEQGVACRQKLNLAKRNFPAKTACVLLYKLAKAAGCDYLPELGSQSTTA